MEKNKILLDSFETLSNDMLNQLELYCNILQEESQKINLTSISETNDIYIKHFYDSMLISKVTNLKEKELVDVGTGAGFPGIVLKIIEPTLKVTLIEPTTKRCNFLNLVINKLQLKDIVVINERAEKCITKYREKFDIVTARAVANLPILLELLTPLCKINGVVIPMKGSNVNEELNQATNAIKTLNLKLIDIYQFTLPLDKGMRNIVKFQKQKKTLEIYPRDYAKILKKPL